MIFLFVFVMWKFPSYWLGEFSLPGSYVSKIPTGEYVTATGSEKKAWNFSWD